MSIRPRLSELFLLCGLYFAPPPAFAQSATPGEDSANKDTAADPSDDANAPLEPENAAPSSPYTDEKEPYDDAQGDDSQHENSEVTPDDGKDALSEEAPRPEERAATADQQTPEPSQGDASEKDKDEADVAKSAVEEGTSIEAVTKDPFEGKDQRGTPPPPPRPSEGEELPQGKWEKDYDGRREPTRADEVLIWIPRAPLYPVHLALNYGVRWPIVGLMTLAEKHKVPQRVQDFFTFADGKAGIYPVGFYDAGRGFWGGLNFFYNDLGRAGHSLRATAGIGTADWIVARIRDSWTVFENNRGTLTFSATFLRDPNLAFTGLGPDTQREDLVFFLEEKIEGAVDLEVALEGLNRFSFRADFKTAELGSGRSPGIDQSDFDTEMATGFDDHFTLGGVAMSLELDSRSPRDEFVPGSGIALKTWGSYHYGPGERHLSFLRYGIRPRAYIDLSGANHVLVFGVRAEAVSKLGGEDLPYNELISLGGREALLGFLPGRFRGDSSLVYQLDYSWPLLSFADAILFTELGNVFSGFYRDFNHELMALDWGTGLRSSFSRELQVQIAIGFGTNQIKYWDDAFVVDQVRFIVGATHRF